MFFSADVQVPLLFLLRHACYMWPMSPQP
jgi:hypothetical protein